MLPFAQGRALIFDVTTRCTLAPTYVQASARNVGHVAELADRDKREKYRELATNYLFQPVAFDTFGPASASTVQFIKQLGRKMALSNGDDRSGDYLFQRLSLSVQRGNAAAVLGGLPPSSQEFLSFI